MIIQGSERDQFQFQIPIPIQVPSLSMSTSLSLASSPQIIIANTDLDADAISTSSAFSSSSSSSYFQLLGSLDASLTPLAPVNNSYSASKRALEQQLADAGDSDECADPKKRRLMKNRESATRSRARKLALMNELKVEVARLEEENLKLKDQCKELKSALAAANASTKKLRRTFSADF